MEGKIFGNKWPHINEEIAHRRIISYKNIVEKISKNFVKSKIQVEEESNEKVLSLEGMRETEKL